MTNGLGALMAALGKWAYPASLIVGLIFWCGVSFSKLGDLSTRMDKFESRMDRMETKLDQLILEIQKR